MPIRRPLPLHRSSAVRTLSADETARWQRVPCSYAEVGATAGVLPDGYRHITRSAVVGRGGADFGRHAETLMGFGVLTGVGIRVSASHPRAAVGVIVRQRVGIGWIRLLAPCRVVRVVEAPRRVGFAYGTLHPHPESGEEEFLLRHDEDDSVTLSVRSFSRHARWFSRLGGRVAVRLQQRYVTRFLAVLTDR